MDSIYDSKTYSDHRKGYTNKIGIQKISGSFARTRALTAFDLHVLAPSLLPPFGLLSRPFLGCLLT